MFVGWEVCFLVELFMTGPVDYSILINIPPLLSTRQVPMPALLMPQKQKGIAKRQSPNIKIVC